MIHLRPPCLTFSSTSTVSGEIWNSNFASLDDFANSIVMRRWIIFAHFRNLMEVLGFLFGDQSNGQIQISSCETMSRGTEKASEIYAREFQQKIYFSSTHTRSTYTRSHYKFLFLFRCSLREYFTLYMFAMNPFLIYLSFSPLHFASWIRSTIVELFNIFNWNL